MTEALKRLATGTTLTRDQARELARTMLHGTPSPLHTAAALTALSARGETVDEITGMATAVREAAVAVPLPGAVLDTCGTGGDGHDTFNISTAAALVVAACGVPVAKHGNRASSSRCGSADVVDALGVRLGQSASDAARCLTEAGITFLHAPDFHPGLRAVGAVRRELGVRTVFNLLGPLCNPARPRYQALGVSNASLVDPMATVLTRLGAHRALVFHAEDGLDELSLGAPTRVVEVAGTRRREHRVEPGALGLTPAPVSALAGGDARDNAALIRAVLDGVRGPARDVVLLNAAAGLLAAGRVPDWHAGLSAAAGAVDSGAAAGVLARWIEVSHQSDSADTSLARSTT